MNRRDFFKVAAAGGAAAALARPRTASASSARRRAGDQAALLIDTTRCAGCRACEVACAEANGLPPPPKLADDSVFDEERWTSTTAFSVVNRRRQQGREDVFVKSQCMHCVSPACASACLVRALEKLPEGPVVYHESRCIGCRYCMVACPFEVPRFEYTSAAPFIRKCQFCVGRQRAGKMPGCATVCPSGAIEYGKRADLLEAAHARIYQEPDRYTHHIYGEEEAGGTCVMYLADRPFEQLAFRDVGTEPLPARTAAFTSFVPLVLSLAPPLLVGLHAVVGRRDRLAAAAQGHDDDPDGADAGAGGEP